MNREQRNDDIQELLNWFKRENRETARPLAPRVRASVTAHVHAMMHSPEALAAYRAYLRKELKFRLPPRDRVPDHHLEVAVARGLDDLGDPMFARLALDPGALEYVAEEVHASAPLAWHEIMAREGARLRGLRGLRGFGGKVSGMAWTVEDSTQQRLVAGVSPAKETVQECESVGECERPDVDAGGDAAAEVSLLAVLRWQLFKRGERSPLFESHLQSRKDIAEAFFLFKTLESYYAPFAINLGNALGEGKGDEPRFEPNVMGAAFVRQAGLGYLRLWVPARVLDRVRLYADGEPGVEFLDSEEAVYAQFERRLSAGHGVEAEGGAGVGSGPGAGVLRDVPLLRLFFRSNQFVIPTMFRVAKELKCSFSILHATVFEDPGVEDHGFCDGFLRDQQGNLANPDVFLSELQRLDLFRPEHGKYRHPPLKSWDDFWATGLLTDLRKTVGRDLGAARLLDIMRRVARHKQFEQNLKRAYRQLVPWEPPSPATTVPRNSDAGAVRTGLPALPAP